MRERLVELIKRIVHSYFAEEIVNTIIADGWFRPPCQVGQTVWLIKSLNWQQTEWGIKEGKISMIQQKADKSWKFRVTENHSVQDYTVDKIGKTVFLTREEAEAKLKEGGRCDRQMQGLYKR